MGVLQGPADVVFDCVANQSTIHQAVAVLRKGGRLAVIGVPVGPTTIGLDLIQDREIEVVGNLMYVRADVLHAIELLMTAPPEVDEMVTAVFPMDQVADAFDAASRPDQVKVLVRL
jgi:threonine dehydrogenase-like Zn-dependent dehydrogenase